MTIRILTLATGLAISTGCILVDPDLDDGRVVVDPGPGPVVVVNSPPLVLDAVGACAYERRSATDIVYFDAVVDDPDGALDVVSVFADVYDDVTGELVQTFTLYPAVDDPLYWTGDAVAASTWIDCWYPYYSVDIVAYDAYDDVDVVTIPLQTYL